MKVVVLVSEMVVGLELELQVVHKVQLVGWIRNSGRTIGLGQVAGNLLSNTGHNLGDYVTGKYRQNFLTRATVPNRSLWLTANMTTCTSSSGNTCFGVLVNSRGTAMS